MTDWSEAETKALAGRAALGAGLPHAQAALYGQAAVLHLAQGGDVDVLSTALADPAVTSLVTRIATLPPGPYTVPDHPLAAALVASLPGNASGGTYDPIAPRPPHLPSRVSVPQRLEDLWRAYAQKTYVPDSALSHAGAGGADD